MKSFLLVLSFIAVCSAVQNWELIQDSGNRPSRRGAARMVNIGNKLILFAGFEECFDINAGCDHIFYNQVWHFDVSDDTWTQAAPTSSTGTLPGERAFLGSAKYALTDSIIYFGGVKYNILFNVIIFYGDVWEYFPATDHFVLRTQQGAVGPSGHIGPGPRAGVALAIDGHTMYAVAGIDDTGFLTYRNDVWKYNLQTNTWTILFQDRSGSPSATPPVRYLASMIFHPQNPASDELVVFGGNAEPTGSGNQNQDTWRFDLATNGWTLVNSVPGPSVGRTHGAFALWQDKFFIALGDFNDDAVECVTNEVSGGQLAVNGTWILNLNSNPAWCDANPGSPPKAKRVAFARKSNKMYVWGGFDFDCVTASAIWNTNMFSLHLPSQHC